MEVKAVVILFGSICDLKARLLSTRYTHQKKIRKKNNLKLKFRSLAFFLDASAI